MKPPFSKDRSPRPQARSAALSDYIVLRPFTDVDGRAYAAGDSYSASGPSLEYLLERGCLDAPVSAGAGGPITLPVEPQPLPLEPLEVNDAPTL